jgi:hypothetical protein
MVSYPLLLVCSLNFHLPCPSTLSTTISALLAAALLAFISALLAFIVSICLSLPCRLSFSLSVYSVDFHFCPIGFQCFHLLSACSDGFHLSCPSTPSAPFLPNLAFIVLLWFHFAMSAFICPVHLLCRRLFLPYIGFL